MKLLHSLLVIGGLSTAMVSSNAEQTQAGDKAARGYKPTQEIYGGVVANQTVTVAGYDFYQYFVAAWRDRELSERFAISIHERPSARWGSQIWIQYAQKRVFQASLPSGRAGIKALSEQAVEIAFEKVAEVEVERLLTRNSDMGPDEI